MSDEAAAKLAYWERIIESVQGLSPEAKLAWFEFKHLPDSTSNHPLPPLSPAVTGNGPSPVSIEAYPFNGPM